MIGKSGLQVLTSVLEVIMYIGAFIGALGGVSYVVANRHLQRILKQEADTERKTSETQRQQMQERIAASESITASANQRAEEAIEGQKKLEVAAEAARAHQRELELQAEQLRKEQEEVRTRNLELQAQVEKERAARLKLEQQVAPRTITATQEARLTTLLRQAKGSVVSIRATNSTSESAQFAEQLRNVFVSAGWKADPVFYNWVAGVRVEPGVFIVVQNDRSQLGILVQQAFHSVGIDLTGAIDPKAPPDAVALIVGQRPAQ